MAEVQKTIITTELDGGILSMTVEPPMSTQQRDILYEARQYDNGLPKPEDFENGSVWAQHPRFRNGQPSRDQRQEFVATGRELRRVFERVTKEVVLIDNIS